MAYALPLIFIMLDEYARRMTEGDRGLSPVSLSKKDLTIPQRNKKDVPVLRSEMS